MVRKIIAFVSVVFFAALFLACSSNPPKPEDWPSNAKETNIPKDYDKIGFFQHPEHTYGFDRHPDPKNGIGVVAHVSTFKETDAIVTARVSDELDYDYFICNQNKERIKSIGSTKSDYRYAIPTGDFKAGDGIQVALCRERKGKTQKLQELYVHPYDWKEYDFGAYILGDETTDMSKLLVHDPKFWVSVDSTFAQAVVRHREGGLDEKFTSNNKGYVLMRANGNYYGCDYYDSDIDMVVREIVNDKKAKRKNIIQINYPTRRFWPLKSEDEEDDESEVKICGKPIDKAEAFNDLRLELSPDPEDHCPTSVGNVKVFNKDGIWKLDYGNRIEDAIKENADPRCFVFAETKTGTYFGDSDDDNAVAFTSYIRDYFRGDVTHSIAVLPATAYNAKRSAIHELGHTIGLSDVYDIPLACITPNKDKGTRNEMYTVCKENEENNLMFFTVGSEKYKLRKRSIKTANEPGYENQWECLRRINTNNNCLDKSIYLGD